MNASRRGRDSSKITRRRLSSVTRGCEINGSGVGQDKKIEIAAFLHGELRSGTVGKKFNENIFEK